MHLHADHLTSLDFYEAARRACVDFARLDEKGSRTRTRKFDFLLTGWSSNRRPNWGTGDRDMHDDYAATWDEWGILLNVLFTLDPEAHTGQFGYTGLEHYRYATNGRFETLTHAEQHVNHTWNQPAPPYARACKCGAMQRWDRPVDIRVVKHGLVIPDQPATVERWLATA